MPFSPCKHHITFVSGQVVPSVLAASLPDTPGRHGSRQRPRARWAAVTARSSEQQGGIAGKDAIDKRQGDKIARIAAIPGKQAVRDLLGVKKDFFSYPEKVIFYFSLSQKVAHDFYILYQKDRSICQTRNV